MSGNVDILISDLATEQSEPLKRSYIPHIDVIMMRQKQTGFTRLPLDPPFVHPPSLPNCAPPPIYQSPPEYRTTQAARRQPQYQEIPYETAINLPPTTPEQIQLEPVSSSLPLDHSSRQCDTEVDQAFSMSTSNSTIPLTQPPLPPAERKPRKKTNPLYDSYGAPVSQVSTKTSSHRSGKEAKEAGHVCTCGHRCLRHPFTLLLFFLIVIGTAVALILLIAGTIEQVTPGDTGKLVATPAPSAPSTIELLERQQALIDELLARVLNLERVIGGTGEANMSVEAKVAKNTFQIGELNKEVTDLKVNTTTQMQKVEGSVKALDDTVNLLSTAVASQSIKITNLEQQNISVLHDEVKQLKGKAQTQSLDINEINNVNTNQATEISALKSDINVLEQAFDFKLQTFNTSIYEDLNSISKMEGPRGYNGTKGVPGDSGSGNLTLCFYQDNVASIAGDREINTLPFFSDSTGIITGVTCSTYGATIATLRTEIVSGITEFHCQCTGTPVGFTENIRHCIIHVWRCPT